MSPEDKTDPAVRIPQFETPLTVELLTMMLPTTTLLGNDPTRLIAGILKSPAADPKKVLAVTFPETPRDVSVPTEVMFDCAGAVTTAARGTMPVTLAPVKAESPTPFPANEPEEVEPVTVSDTRFPTDVMFG